VTTDPFDIESGTRNAVAEAARALRPDDLRAHVFFEERKDERMTLASSGLKDLVAWRSRGAVAAGRHSIHLTDPNFLERISVVPDPTSESNSMEAVERMLLESGTAACAGRRHPFWSATVVSFYQAIWVGSPNGSVRHDLRRGCRVNLRVQVDTGVDTSHAVEEFVLKPRGPHNVSEAFSRAFERAEEKGAVRASPPRGSTVAVFAPGTAGVMAHELIGHALEGDVLARGQTWIRSADLRNAGRPLTVIDDPRKGRGAWKLDDEGVDARETILIDRGRLVGMLLDRASARSFGLVSTGHGRRSSYLEAVRSRMGCTFIDAGSDDPGEILRSTREGVFIRRLAAGHVDPVEGRASFIVSDADLIRDGRLSGPLEAFVIELTGMESWSSIDRVAHDLTFDTCIGSCVRDGQPLAVSVGAPTIRIGVVRVRS
jgi:TldD protein